MQCILKNRKIVQLADKNIYIPGTTLGTTTLLSSTAATGLFAAVGIAKAIGIGLLLREAAGRSKRAVNSLSVDSSFAIISQLEPAQCMRRLICDIASGEMASDETDEVILAPFEVRNTFTKYLLLN